MCLCLCVCVHACLYIFHDAHTSHRHFSLMTSSITSATHIVTSIVRNSKRGLPTHFSFNQPLPAFLGSSTSCLPCSNCYPCAWGPSELLFSKLPNTHTHTHARTHTRARTHTHTHTHTHLRTHTHTHTHTHARTHAHTHACTHTLSVSPHCSQAILLPR